MIMRDVELIGIASGWGAPDPGCADGPRALRDAAPLVCVLPPRRRFSVLLQPQDEPGETSDLGQVAELARRLAETVSYSLLRQRFPVVIGGDHACAIGTWSGAHAALAQQQESLGLLWVDAHMDAHVPATSPSGALHGMPLACLLGEGDATLISVAGAAPKLLPERVCVIGVRSYEPGERELLQRLGVKVFYMEEIQRRGFAAVWHEALEHVRAHSTVYGLTIDVDALDPRDAPGVGSPEPDGIAAVDLVAEVRALAADERLCALEIAEFNPHHDREDRTLRVVRELICAVTGKDEHDR